MAGVNVKMGVSGVSEFKRSMKESQNAVKTLDAELKRNEAQYKATGDKENYMAERSKLLKAQLEAQKNAAKQAEKALDTMRKQGVEQTSAEYQNMARQMANAQAAMYNTQAAINGLNGAQVKASQSASDLSNNVASIGKKMSLQQVQSGLKGVEDKLKSAASYALQIGKNIVSSVTEGASWADDLVTQSTIYGIDLQTLQKMSVAGKIFDTSVETIIGAERKLKRGIGSDAANTKKALEGLNIKMYDVFLNDAEIPEFEKKAKSAKDLFWEIGEAIMNLGPDREWEQEDWATKLFGRSWTDLKPLFEKGRDAYESYLESHNALSDESVDKLATLQNQIDELNYQWNLTKLELESALAPALTKVGEIATNLLKEFNDYLESEDGQKKLGELSEAVSSLFEGLEDVDPETLMNGVISVIDGLVESLKWIKQNWASVEVGIKAIVAAWAITKVGTGITMMTNLVNGLRGLFGKGNGGTGTGTPTVSPTGTGTGTGAQSVATMNVTTQSVATGNTTTEHVTTMYVGNMIGGRTPGTNPTGNNPVTNNPAIDSGGGGGNYITGGGGGGNLTGGSGTGFNGYFPVFSNGGGDLLMPNPNTINIGNGGSGVNIDVGGSPTLNLTGGNGDAIQLDPSEWSIDGSDVTGTGIGATIAKILTSTSLKVASGFALGAYLTLKPGNTMGNKEDDLWAEAITKANADAGGEVINAIFSDLDQKAWAAVEEWAAKGVWGTSGRGETGVPTLDEYMELITTLQEMGYKLKDLDAVGVVTDQQRAAMEAAWDALNGNGDYDAAYANLAEAFKDNPELHDRIVKKMDELWASAVDSYQQNPDLPDDWFLETELKVPEDEGDQIRKQVGTIILPAELAINGNGEEGEGFANGIWDVPFNGMLALLHKGERVLTARENKQYTYNNNNYFGNVNLNNGLEIDALSESIARQNRRSAAGYGT